MDEEKILEYFKPNGYNYIEYIGEWKQYKVYALIRDKDATSFVGFPFVGLVEGEKIRISTREESLEIIDYFYPPEDEDLI